MSEKIITIFGTARAKPGDTVFNLAGEIGRSLAEAGFTIANGGYEGTMLAAADGANRAGGKVIGVTCKAFKRTANEFVTKEIVTESLQQRLDTLINIADGYVVLQGGTGTLVELSLVWELRNKGFFEKDKPIIVAGDFWVPLIDLIAKDDRDSVECIKMAKDAGQVMKILSDWF
jgi:uncharacterized protein (TIGR00730 family)